MFRRHSGAARLTAGLALLALTAAACSSDDDDPVDSSGSTTTEAGGGAVGASVDGALNIFAVLPLTGDLAAFGPGMTAAAELAVEDANAAGFALNGIPATFSSADSATDPEVAKTATDGAIADGADAIIGAAGSTVLIQGVFPSAIGAGRLECTSSSTSPILTTKPDDGLFFRTAPSDAFQSQLLTTKITGEGHETVGILFRDDDYGAAFAGLLEEALADAGVDVAASIAVDPDKDIDAAISELDDADADAHVFILFTDGAGPKAIAAAAEAGIGPADVPMYVADGLASDTLGETTDPANPSIVDDILGTRPGGGGADTSVFDARLVAEKGVDGVTFGAGTYDCVTIIMVASYLLGTDDPRQIADALVELSRGGEKCVDFASCKAIIDADPEADIDFDGLTGFDFNDLGELSKGTYEFFTYENAAIKVLETVTLGE